MAAVLQILHIENIAVIEQADIELENGLTVLSGETGAGKSILIDSVGALLGARTRRDLVRAGAAKGFVSAVFSDLSPALTAMLKNMDLAGEEEDMLQIQRQLTADGRSVCRVNMRPVTMSVLKTLAPYLINIHGQHDGQRLLDEKYQIDYLDQYTQAEAQLETYLPLYHDLLRLKREITELEIDEQQLSARLDILTYQRDEIEQAQIQPEEEEKLLSRKQFFDAADQIQSALSIAQQALLGDDENAGACTLLGSAAQTLDKAAPVLPEFSELSSMAQEAQTIAEELQGRVGHLADTCGFSPQERERVEQRLDLLYHLKQKYGADLPAVLRHYEAVCSELESLESADTKREELRSQYREKLALARKTAQTLSVLRQEAAKRLEREIAVQLRDLDMLNIRFKIDVQTGSKLTSHGMDTVRFLLSANPGEPEKPLAQIASGGELSRIMLAMKNVLTAGEDVGMLIFDEIDTGVSGHAAQQIARKLSEIAQKKQTLCVTHLPQIAAMGDHHLLISKSVQAGRSVTNVQPVEHAARVQEIARMISGDTITEASQKNAEELLLTAQGEKESRG